MKGRSDPRLGVGCDTNLNSILDSLSVSTSHLHVSLMETPFSPAIAFCKPQPTPTSCNHWVIASQSSVFIANIIFPKNPNSKLLQHFAFLHNTHYNYTCFFVGIIWLLSLPDQRVCDLGTQQPCLYCSALPSTISTSFTNIRHLIIIITVGHALQDQSTKFQTYQLKHIIVTFERKLSFQFYSKKYQQISYNTDAVYTTSMPLKYCC